MEIYTENLQLPDVRLNIRHFVNAKNGAKKIFFLHGWMDASPSWQFVVNALQKKYHIIAPDWRGFGDSEWLDRVYHFRCHIADLHAILNAYSPDAPALLVGHSMGGMIACTYSGLFPERVARVMTLEGFGLSQRPPEVVRELMQTWINNRLIRPKMRIYKSREEFAQSQIKKNSRLTVEKAKFLAETLTWQMDNGYVFNADPWHKLRLPQRFPVEEMKAIWRHSTAKIAWVAAENSWVMADFEDAKDDYQSRIDCFANIKTFCIKNCGHMLHHDQPEKVAACIDDFFD